MIKIFLCLLISLSLTSAAKQIRFHYNGCNKMPLSFNGQAAYDYYNNNLYYVSSSLKKGSLESTDSVKHILYTYRFLTKMTDSMDLVFPPYANARGFSIQSIQVNNQYIIIAADGLYIFDVDRKYLRTFNSYNINDMRLFADHLILYKNYNNHPSDDTVITKFWNYDIKKNKIIKSQNFYFSYPSYTHLVGNFIDISGNNIAFSQTIPYHIDILSPGFDIKDRIVGAPFKNDEYFLEKIDSLHQVLYKSVGIKEVLYALRKQDSIKRIEKVIFLDSVTLLVSKTIPKGGWEKRSLDVWQLKRGHWVQVVFDQLYETEKKGDYFLTSETIPLDLTFSNKLIIVKGHVYLVNPKIGPATGINKSDYDKSMNEYYEHNSLNYFLWDFKWEIN